MKSERLIVRRNMLCTERNLETKQVGSEASSWRLACKKGESLLHKGRSPDSPVKKKPM